MKNVNSMISNKNLGKKLDKGMNNIAKSQNEIYGNDNLFKNDTYYSMGKNLTFDTSQVESSFRTGVFVRNLDLIKLAVFFYIFVTAYKIYTEWKQIYWLLSILRIIISIIIFSFSMAFLNLNKLETNSYIRWFIEIDIILNILIKTKYSYGFEMSSPIGYNSQFNNTATNISDLNQTQFDNMTLFSSLPEINLKNFQNKTINNSNRVELFYFLLSNFGMGIIYNNLFLQPIDQCLYIGLIEISAILFTYSFPNNFFFTRFFYNIISQDGFKIFFIYGLVLFIQFHITKAARELWALFDSFKRSYYNLKMVYDEFPYPVFIISRKQYSIYYKNLEADKLYEETKKQIKQNENKSSTSMHTKTMGRKTPTKVDYNFKDLFNKHLETLLDNEIEKTLSQEKKYFDFPFDTSKMKNPLNFRERPGLPTIYEGDLYHIDWIRIYVYPCNWRGTESLMIQLMENTDLKNNLFIQDYYHLINKEFMTVLDNIDHICDNAPELKEKISTYAEECDTSKNNINLTVQEEDLKKLASSPSSNVNMSKGFDEIEKNIKGFVRPTQKNLTEKLKSNQGISLLFQKPDVSMSSSMPIHNTKNNLSSNSTANSGMSQNAKNGHPHSANENINGMESYQKIKNCPFDYATLFLLKNSLNYIYDMYLTLNTFNCLRMSKINKRLTNLNFEYFVNYMINYFYPISKVKNFKIDLKSDLEGEVYAIYDYYRVIFFNVIIFILNNSRDSKKEKTLTITVKHHIFTENQGSYYKAIFSFNDDSPYIPYNLLNDVLNSLKNTELNKITLEKYRLIDFGLIVSFYIANTVYNSEFVINTMPNSNNHMIIVNILASNTSNAKDIGQQGNMQLSQLSMQNTIRSIVATKLFKKPKTYIEENYYNKILAKLYRDNKSTNSHDGILNTHSKNVSNNLKNTIIKRTSTLGTAYKRMGFNAKDVINKIDKKAGGSDSLYDDGTNDAYHSDEDKDNQLTLDMYQYREFHTQLQSNKSNFDKYLKLTDSRNMIKIIKDKSSILNRKKIDVKCANSENNVLNFKSNRQMQDPPVNKISIRWDFAYMIENIQFCKIPRFLIVEDTYIGRVSLSEELKKLKIEYRIDIASDGSEAIEKFKFLINQGCLYDFIFMDINLNEMSGIDATKHIRNMEKQYGNIRTTIIAISIDAKQQSDLTLFDHYFEKPIKSMERLSNIIKTHFAKHRKDININ